MNLVKPAKRNCNGDGNFRVCDGVPGKSGAYCRTDTPICASDPDNAGLGVSFRL